MGSAPRWNTMVCPSRDHVGWPSIVAAVVANARALGAAFQKVSGEGVPQDVRADHGRVDAARGGEVRRIVLVLVVYRGSSMDCRRERGCGKDHRRPVNNATAPTTPLRDKKRINRKGRSWS